jgi:hypothetical protein
MIAYGVITHDIHPPHNVTKRIPDMQVGLATLRTKMILAMPKPHRSFD